MISFCQVTTINTCVHVLSHVTFIFCGVLVQTKCKLVFPPSQVTLEGIPQIPEELDNYYKDKGPIPKFGNDFGCITDVVGYEANTSALGKITFKKG